MCCRDGLSQVGRLNKSGMQDLNQGRVHQAMEKLLAALAQVRSVGSVCYEAKILNNLGLVYHCQGNTAGADRNYRQAKAIVQEKIGTQNVLYTTICRNLDRLEEDIHSSREKVSFHAA